MASEPVRREWWHVGACRDEDPELFFPVGETPLAKEQAEEAKVVCEGCPVRVACLSWALSTRQEHGVWGGKSEQERRSLLRRGAVIRRAKARARSKGAAA